VTRPGSTLWDQVDRYARDRAKKRGDLFGWTLVPARDESPRQEQIVFFVARDANEAEFPKEIHGHEVVLRRITEPRPQKTRA
jgi:hypothetical protein